MKEIITKKYIFSDAYEEIMMKNLRETDDMYNLADWTPNFAYRQEKLWELGCWKWMCTFKNREIIAKFVFSDQKGVDFGGHAGPIYGNTDIVDYYPEGQYPRMIDFKELDYVFSSHTLEHIPDYKESLKEIYDSLRKGGTYIIIVPSYTCERWRAFADGTSHKHTFSLEDDNFENIEKEIRNIGFKVDKAEYTWDSSIFIMGRK